MTGDTDDTDGSKAESEPSAGQPTGLVKEAAHSSSGGIGDCDDGPAMDLVVLGDVGEVATPAAGTEHTREAVTPLD